MRYLLAVVLAIIAAFMVPAEAQWGQTSSGVTYTGGTGIHISDDGVVSVTNIAALPAAEVDPYWNAVSNTVMTGASSGSTALPVAQRAVTNATDTTEIDFTKTEADLSAVLNTASVLPSKLNSAALRELALNNGVNLTNLQVSASGGFDGVDASVTNLSFYGLTKMSSGTMDFAFHPVIGLTNVPSTAISGVVTLNITNTHPGTEAVLKSSNGTTAYWTSDVKSTVSTAGWKDYFDVRLSANSNAANTAWVPIAMKSEVTDPDGVHNSTTGIIILSSTGMVTMTWNVHLNNITDQKSWRTILYKNKAQYQYGGFPWLSSSGAGPLNSMSGATFYNDSATNQYLIWGYNGGAATHTMDSTATLTYWRGYRLKNAGE